MDTSTFDNEDVFQSFLTMSPQTLEAFLCDTSALTDQCTLDFLPFPLSIDNPNHDLIPPLPSEPSSISPVDVIIAPRPRHPIDFSLISSSEKNPVPRTSERRPSRSYATQARKLLSKGTRERKLLQSSVFVPGRPKPRTTMCDRCYWHGQKCNRDPKYRCDNCVIEDVECIYRIAAGYDDPAPEGLGHVLGTCSQCLNRHSGCDHRRPCNRCQNNPEWCTDVMGPSYVRPVGTKASRKRKRGNDGVLSDIPSPPSGSPPLPRDTRLPVVLKPAHL